ncbi:MAG: hypothetical protein CL609_08125 [Anaerolineaceae bacterium]|nr:hypothetical protein [Anaerolineaceae bacterium]
MKKLKTNPPSNLVKISAFLFVLIGLIWFVFSVITLTRASVSSILPTWLIWLLSAMMVGNGLLLIVVSWGIRHQKRRFYWFGLILLFLNILLTFTDQFGLFDLVTLLLDVGLFIVLIFTKKHYSNF